MENKIASFYDEYTAIGLELLDIETNLVNAKSETEFVSLLKKKSKLLRETFNKNELKLKELIYPYLNGEIKLNDSISDIFYTKSIELLKTLNNDALLGADVLKMVNKYYEKNKIVDKYFLSSYYIGLSYCDRLSSKYNPVTREYFSKCVISAKDYNKITDWETKKRVCYSYYDLLTNPDINTIDEMHWYMDTYLKVIKFYDSIDMDELTAHFPECVTLLDETHMAIVDALYEARVEPDKQAIQFFESYLKMRDYSPDDLTIAPQIYAGMIYYNCVKRYMSVSEGVKYLFAKYESDDKKIDYKDTFFYESDAYLYQMKYMQLIIGLIGKAGDTQKLAPIKEKMISDFTKLVVSVPYINNNEYLNYDLTVILNKILKITYDENKSIDYVVDVVLRRSVMTYLHSSMLSRITSLIMDAIIDDNCDLLFPLLKTKKRNDVLDSREFLLDYIQKASLLHDIGKTRVSDIINLQTRKITPMELDIIKDHPELGYEIIKGSVLEEKYGDCIIGHHKSVDYQAGYPENVVKYKKPRKIITDIIVIADAMEAGTDILGRNYTDPKSLEDILEELKNKEEYNEDIVTVILNNKDLLNKINNIITVDRQSICYEIYQDLKK